METETAKRGAALVLLAFSAVALAEPTSRVPVLPLEEQRYCGPPPRLPDGSIKRRSDVLAAFRKAHPCPVTGLSTGVCPNWQINHTVSLICGGCDSVSNLAWVPSIMKSGPGVLPIDRWEQKVYCADRRELVPMPDPMKFRLEMVPRTVP